MKRTTLIVCIGILSQPCIAKDLTLSDIPSVLETLRGCKSTMFGTSCDIETSDMWVSIHTKDGKLDITLFTRDRYKDMSVYASGDSVSSMLADYAAKLNRSTRQNSEMLKRLGPYLPTQ